MAPLCGRWQVRDSQLRDDEENASLHFLRHFVRGHDSPELQRQEAQQSSCRDQKAVKFQVKIHPSALEKTHYENITMFSMANLALANAALG